MRIYWWQGGLFLHPETKKEKRGLVTISDSLESSCNSKSGMLIWEALSYFAKSLITSKVGYETNKHVRVPPELVDDLEEET